MNAFFQAVGFLTRIPVPPLRHSAEDWQKSVACYPLVGALIGLLLWGVNHLALLLFTPTLAAVLTLAFWVYITGGLHLDGWMDLADALGSNRSRERMLEIMKDSRVGAMGVLAAILLLMVKGAALYDVGRTGLNSWMVLVPTIARTHLLLAIRLWPYVSEGGLGSDLHKALHFGNIALGYGFTLLLCWFFGGGQAVIVLLLTLLGSLSLSRTISKKLGGFTGDAYGAVIEWNEAAALLLSILAWGIQGVI
jgi:adenosylcobinamide-GDP ribazoletransferase